MRVFVTGATGFIVGEVARRLRARVDEVVALVRDPARAQGLGYELVEGDLGDADAIRRGLEGCDAAVHGAAVYQVGVSGKAAAAMREANVGGTERVLGTALELGTAKVVYVSTVAVFGNTHGQVVDETSGPASPPLAVYDETKREAHELAAGLIAAGLPCAIVQPGAVYGPGDPSQLGGTLRRVAAGRMPLIAFADCGLNAVHRDDVAGGILLALDRGRVGEAYVLGGELTTIGAVAGAVARLTGHRAPRSLPPALLRAAASVSPRVRDLVASSDGVTYWASDAKARSELGYAPRELEPGLRETLAAEGLL
ncbi:MAG: NAD-dependent epimerase/dehydratase family protein [Gaiellaceae bacterium]